MNISTSVSTIFFGLCVFGAVTSSLAFSPATTLNSITTSARLSNNNIKGTTTQLNYIREVEVHGVSLVLDSSSLSNFNRIKDCLSSLDENEDDDDFVDPMAEEAFDNMQTHNNRANATQ
jgi:hypothetical protein